MHIYMYIYIYIHTYIHTYTCIFVVCVCISAKELGAEETSATCFHDCAASRLATPGRVR